MKIIKLTESQFKNLLEANGVNAPNFNGGDIKKFPGSEVSTSSNVTSQDGEIEYGKQPTSDEIAKIQTIQNYWANAHNGARVMP